MIFYAYFGYPLCLLIISLFKNPTNLYPVKCPILFNWGNKPLAREIHDSDSGAHCTGPTNPSVSLIITAYNEEKRIKEKIENTINHDYPKEKLEIIIASDCSSDKTDEIVKSFKDKDVKLVRAPERKGKENAQKHAIDASNGEILVFSDVATILKPDAISNIVKNFNDPSIGCVSSEDKFIDLDGNVSGEGTYVKYEMLLRTLESKVNTLVGLSGSFFAARREVCENWAIDLQSDFNTLLNSVKSGLKGILDPRSIGYYKNISDEKKEFDRKVRTVLRGISVLMRNLSLLNPIKYGLFSWQLFSHKLCRWLIPFFLILVFLSNAILMFSSIFFFCVFVMQIAYYSLVIFCFQKETRNPQPVTRNDDNDNFSSVLKIPYFFITVNVSIFVAWFKYFKGDRATFWEPSER